MMNDKSQVTSHMTQDRTKTKVFVFVFISCVLCLVSCVPAYANNLNISNISVASQDTSANTVTLQFDISWDNSWYDSVNKDAAWVFIKYSTDGGTVWNHAAMNASGTNPTGWSTGSGTEIDIISSVDKRGFFVQRRNVGSGTLSTTSVQVIWDYGNDGVSDANANNNSTRFKIFGIEMTLVPAGSFYLGDGVTGANGQIQWDASIQGTVSDEVGTMVFAATVATANAWYYNTDPATGADNASGTAFSIGTSFPKGFTDFYAMKYEITQGQYKDFLNTLTRAQQQTRVATTLTDAITNIYVLVNSNSVTNRQTINAPSTGNGATAPVVFSTLVSGVDKADRACNYLSWMDFAAYLDWAALRPMTEFEYEKLARGPLYPLAADYAWGSSAAAVAAATISGTENGTETISTANANANFGNPTVFTGGDASSGPLRVGIYATSSNNTRILTGAGYYGNMELTANVYEEVVSIGHEFGRGYIGSHGDGVLTSTTSYEGNATNLDWPGLDATSNARGITGATGSGLKGGSYNTTAANLAARASISSRYNTGLPASTRGTDYGGRGVRTASA